jgi:Fanconi anemia group M protein
MSDKEQVSVIIDSNEEAQNQQFVENMVLHEDVEDFTIEPLETGDFIIEDCVFERKTPSDFAGSLQKGRLREQVERLGAGNNSPYVLVEGDMDDFSDLEHTNIPPKSLRGMTASIMARNKIPVVFCSDAGNLADVSVRIARKSVEDVNEQHVKTDAVQEVPFITKTFMNVEGVGLRTAKDLADEFSTVKQAIEAETEELQRVDGVGPKTAESIYQALHNESDDTEKESVDKQRTMVRI